MINQEIVFDYSKIKSFEDIPLHGDPNGIVESLPKGFRGNEEKYEAYIKENGIDASKLSKEEVEKILEQLQHS